MIKSHIRKDIATSNSLWLVASRRSRSEEVASLNGFVTGPCWLLDDYQL